MINQNKPNLLDCFSTGQGQSIENTGQNLALASDTVTPQLDFFSFSFFLCKILSLHYRKRKTCLVS